MLVKADVATCSFIWVLKKPTQQNHHWKCILISKIMKYFILLGRRKSKMPADSKKIVTKTWGLVNILGVFSNAFEVHPLTVLLKNVFKVCILFFWWITRISGSCLNLVQHKLQLKQRRRKWDENAWRNFECPCFEKTLNILALMYFTILAWLHSWQYTIYTRLGEPTQHDSLKQKYVLYIKKKMN